MSTSWLFPPSFKPPTDRVRTPGEDLDGPAERTSQLGGHAPVMTRADGNVVDGERLQRVPRAGPLLRAGVDYDFFTGIFDVLVGAGAKVHDFKLDVVLEHGEKLVVLVVVRRAAGWALQKAAKIDRARVVVVARLLLRPQKKKKRKRR